MRRSVLQVLGLVLSLQIVHAASASAQQAAPAPAREPDVVFVPTPPEVVDAMLDLANVAKGDVVYDLGCGDGRIVIAAAKRGADLTREPRGSEGGVVVGVVTHMGNQAAAVWSSSAGPRPVFTKARSWP